MFMRIFVIAVVLAISGVSLDVSAQGVPVTAVPSGFGHYCSIRYPGGGWAFSTLTGTNSDPCGALRKTSPGGTIERAGLWSIEGQNNVMVRCDGDLRIYRETGSKATGIAYDAAQGKKNCIFIIAPTALRVFGRPYGKTTAAQANPNNDVSVARGFDYNIYRQPWNVADFGQQPVLGLPEAYSVDRLGKQHDRLGTTDECAPKPAGCRIVPGEPAYDWIMPGGKPILSVAEGIVRGARERDVSSYGCGPDKQMEIYIEHQVGTGEYAERFISYYAHMSKISVKTGDIVSRGQKIGEAGNTGCSGAITST